MFPLEDTLHCKQLLKTTKSLFFIFFYWISINKLRKISKIKTKFPNFRLCTLNKITAGNDTFSRVSGILHGGKIRARSLAPGWVIAAIVVCWGQCCAVSHRQWGWAGWLAAVKIIINKLRNVSIYKNTYDKINVTSPKGAFACSP